jgi:hypothetical protein
MKKKGLLFITSVILITAMIPFSVSAAEVTVASFDMVFDTAISEFPVDGGHRAIVRLYKDGVSPDSAADEDYVNLHTWRTDADNMRFGVALPSIGNPLSVRHDFGLELEELTKVTVKFTKNTADGKWMLYVNDVKINEVNWNAENADNPNKETDNIYYWSEESKRNPEGTWGDTFDFLQKNPVSTWKFDVNPDSAVSYKIENLIITDPDAAAPQEQAAASEPAQEAPQAAPEQVSAVAPQTSDSFVLVIGAAMFLALAVIAFKTKRSVNKI